MPVSEATLRAALAAYTDDPAVTARPILSGLINATFDVRAQDGRWVLQRLNPIFDPGIHHNIEAVTRHLERRGVETPLLVRNREGALWTTLPDGSVWRVQTHVAGVTRARVERPDDAREAGRLLARFHGALEDLDHDFVALRLNVHDLDAHLAALERALAERRDHRLYGRVAPLASELLARARELPSIEGLPRRPVHGDPKLSNVLFAAQAEGVERARCLVDLDTVAPQCLVVELGDAWRSWCNPAGEDGGEARFDLELFDRAVAGYSEGRGPTLGDAERGALDSAAERISLELATRFAADALEERYFGWDPERFPGAGEHQLLRAERQWQLHGSAREARPQIARILARL